MTSGGSSGKPGRSKTLAQKVVEEKGERAEAKAGPEDISSSEEKPSGREPGHHPSEQAREEAEAAIRARSFEAIGAVLAGEALSGPEPDFEALAERLARLHEKKKEGEARASLSSAKGAFSSADSAETDSADAEERIAKTIERLHHLADRERVAYVRASREGITRRDETKREATKKTG